MRNASGRGRSRRLGGLLRDLRAVVLRDRLRIGIEPRVLRPEEVRQLRDHHALVVAENGRPIIATLTRSIEGKPGWQLLSDQARLRATLTGNRSTSISPEARATAALAEARRLGFCDPDHPNDPHHP